MMKRKTKRLAAFSLAVVLGVAGVTGYGSFTGKDMAVSEAAGAQGVSFAEGAGTGEDFKAGSWRFMGQGVNDSGSSYKLGEAGTQGYNPGIYDNEYTNEHEPIIRLIQGVKSQKTGGQDNGREDVTGAGYNHDYRSGAAFLDKEIRLDENAAFSIKYTFSMPTAVVNVGQNGAEEKYIREYGGDGIAFVMTTRDWDNFQVNAGSGIGYGGFDNNSLAIEMDSFFNGTYYYPENASSSALENWNFDNQVEFDGYKGVTSNGPNDKSYNYENKNHAERFDHFAVTLNGNTKQHERIRYLNGVTPTKDTMAYDRTTSNNTENTSNTCETRFTDKGVNNRLFTVWVDYDGTKMHISYANGTYESAVKPSTPQIEYPVNLKTKFANQTVHVGFTSSVGTSKANHTIHSFYFNNKAEAYYKLNYYLKQADGTYQIDSSKPSEIKSGEVGTTVKAADINSNYKSEYSDRNYVYSTTHAQTDSVLLEKAGETYVMNVYYDPAPAQQAKYKLNYYKLNPVTGDYELSDSTTETVGNVGSTYTVTDVDPAYSNKYSADGYTVNTAKNGDYTVTLNEANKTYVMNVYYDPQKTTYKTEHYLKQEDGTYKLQETVPGEETYAGKPVSAVEKEYPGYTHVKTGDSVESATVQADGSTTLKVYYDPDPVTPAYRLNYHKLNPNTGEYEYITSTGTIVGSLNDTKTITDADPNYEEKYRSDGYEVNNTKNGEWSVELTETDQIYDMHVYYDPKKVSYKTNYYLKQSDGTYKLKESVPGQETYAGTNVDAQIKTYDGYQHVTTPDTLETATVDADGTTTLKVYYDPEPKTTYKVQYYVQQPDGTYKLYEEKKDLPGTIGETVTAQIITINGYVHTTTSDTIETATVNADGTTVLKVYYNLEQVVQPTTEPTTQPTTQPTTEPEEEEPEEPDEEEEEEEETPAKKANKPKTGDETNIAFLLIVTATAGAVGGICLYFRKKEDD